MKKGILIAILGGLSAGACKTAQKAPCPPVTAKAILTETAELEVYLKSAGINATQDAQGYFYTIDKPGTGKQPHACSEVVIDYAGTLTNGKEFDKGNSVSFPLDKLILGWQMGLPKVAEGGAITLYLPPSLAYGEQATEDISANSILIFKIVLHTVKS